MRTLLAACLALVLTSTAWAEQKIRSGELDIHYIVFNSSFLQPNIAQASGLERANNMAVLNVSALRDGKGEKTKVTGTVTNLLGQSTTLSFKEIDEGTAIYSIAQFPITSREMLKFDLQLLDTEQHTHSLKFNQEVFPDP